MVISAIKCYSIFLVYFIVSRQRLFYKDLNIGIYYTWLKCIALSEISVYFMFAEKPLSQRPILNCKVVGISEIRKVRSRGGHRILARGGEII